MFPQIHNQSVRNPTASHLTLITKSNLTLCTVQYEMQLQVAARWSLLRWSWVFIINMLISGNVCSKDFYFYFANTWQERSRQRKKSRVKYSFYWTTIFFSSCVNAWAACSISDKSVYRPPVRGWTCLQDRSTAASTSASSWSPAAMTVTRTSSSRELMASDNCVMGELSGPEVHGSSFYERESLYIGLYFVRMAWA